MNYLFGKFHEWNKLSQVERLNCENLDVLYLNGGHTSLSEPIFIGSDNGFCRTVVNSTLVIKKSAIFRPNHNRFSHSLKRKWKRKSVCDDSRNLNVALAKIVGFLITVRCKLKNVHGGAVHTYKKLAMAHMTTWNTSLKELCRVYHPLHRLWRRHHFKIVILYLYFTSFSILVQGGNENQHSWIKYLPHKECVIPHPRWCTEPRITIKTVFCIYTWYTLGHPSGYKYPGTQLCFKLCRQQSYIISGLCRYKSSPMHLW